jgi:hypothetical protein
VFRLTKRFICVTLFVSASAFAQQANVPALMRTTMAETPEQAEHPSPKATDHSGLSLFNLALSVGGRAAFIHRVPLGGEAHLDEQVRLGKSSRWSIMLGESVGRIQWNEHEPEWLLGGNAALHYDITANGVHGIEVGLSYDDEFHAMSERHRQYLGPYVGYELELTHTYFVAAELGFGLGREEVVPWTTLGFGANLLNL